MRFLETLVLAGFVLTEGKALAEDLPKQEFPSEIVYVPPGSVLSQGLKRSTTSGKTWLFPESYYTTALQKAQKLEICEPALVKLRDDYALLLKDYDEVAVSCAQTIQSSHNREEELTGKVLALQGQNQDLQVKVVAARRSAVLAWTVTGSFLLGAGGAVYFTLQ